jgi:hypothetical protein
MPATQRVAFSFVVDQDPIFAYEGWHLAHSLANHCRVPMSDIHVQFTPEVAAGTVEVFRALGCSVHRLDRFGDGRYCNKLAQWDNLREVPAQHFVFLDTDTLCVANLLEQLPPEAVSAKVVDLDNPALDLLDEIFRRAGFADRPPLTLVDARKAPTYLGNCNGGLYSVPASHAQTLFEAWKRRALGLLADIEPLRRAGKENHVDQISFCLALHETRCPFVAASSNVNYYLHFTGMHRLWNPAVPIALLHYHNTSIDVVGKLQPKAKLQPHEARAVALANKQIGDHFDNSLFWELRYAHFAERGSGVGSRGQNLEYKRALLRAEGIQRAASVLDFGCGDLEVVRALDLHGYVGIDRSAEALARASRARPDWTFMQAPAPDAPACDYVLCFEVAIHQETRQAYFDLVRFLAQKTQKTLIVSGYDTPNPQIGQNHMLFFYEPLQHSLKEADRFASIRQIGAHSDVVIYRCDVATNSM